MAKTENIKKPEFLSRERILQILIPALNKQEINLDKLLEILDENGVIYQVLSAPDIRPEDYEDEEPKEYPIVSIEDKIFSQLRKLSLTLDLDIRDVIIRILEGFLKDIVSDDPINLIYFFIELIEKSSNNNLEEKLSRIIMNLEQNYKYPEDLIHSLKTDIKYKEYDEFHELSLTLLSKAMLLKGFKENISTFSSKSEFVSYSIRNILYP